MATFKVGQRVRLIYQVPASIAMWGDRIGCEGTIVCMGNHVRPDSFCSVRFDVSPEVWAIEAAYHLAPLTDPKAAAFIANIKKLKPYDEPVRHPVRQDVPMATYLNNTLYCTERGAFMLGSDGTWTAL